MLEERRVYRVSKPAGLSCRIWVTGVCAGGHVGGGKRGSEQKYPPSRQAVTPIKVPNLGSMCESIGELAMDLEGGKELQRGGIGVHMRG